VIAEMGDVSASGRYYISVGGSEMAAENLAPTGSAGAVLAKLWETNTKKLNIRNKHCPSEDTLNYLQARENSEKKKRNIGRIIRKYRTNSSPSSRRMHEGRTGTSMYGHSGARTGRCSD